MPAMLTLGLVALGGAIGSAARYLVMELVSRWQGITFPYGTLTVNVLGSFILGVFVGTMARLLPAHSIAIHAFVAIGIMGGFTTFSTFSLDVVTLLEEGNWQVAIAYIIASVVLSVLALALGVLLLRTVAA